MDTTPIFRPPTPPKAGFFFLILFICSIGFSNDSKDPEEPSSYVLYFQPLHEFEWSQTRNYLNQLMSSLKANQKQELAKILKSENSKQICLKKGIPSCEKFFKEPVFNRIEWNKFSIGLNHYCHNHKNPTCDQLAKSHNNFFRSYLVLLRQRKMRREELMKKPYAKKPSRKK